MASPVSVMSSIVLVLVSMTCISLVSSSSDPWAGRCAAVCQDLLHEAGLCEAERGCDMETQLEDDFYDCVDPCWTRASACQMMCRRRGRRILRGCGTRCNNNPDVDCEDNCFQRRMLRRRNRDPQSPEEQESKNTEEPKNSGRPQSRPPKKPKDSARPQRRPLKRPTKSVRPQSRVSRTPKNRQRPQSRPPKSTRTVARPPILRTGRPQNSPTKRTQRNRTRPTTTRKSKRTTTPQRGLPSRRSRPDNWDNETYRRNRSNEMDRRNRRYEADRRNRRYEADRRNRRNRRNETDRRRTSKGGNKRKRGNEKRKMTTLLRELRVLPLITRYR